MTEANGWSKGLAAANATPRCGARCRRNGGAPCRAAAIRGRTRCRLHGGKSTGPRDQGREALAKLRWKHGRRSKLAQQERQLAREALNELRRLLSEV